MEQIEQRNKKPRSPSYPATDLETALGKAEVMRQRENRNWAPMNTILGHWGFSPNSGSGMVQLAALKKFGLLEEQGSGPNRQLRLTQLALSILLDDRQHSSERLSAIQQAALLPTIHTELWAEYHGDLPSDDNLRFQLRSKRGFTDAASESFIPDFHRTLEFAKLTSIGSMSGSPRDRTGAAGADSGQNGGAGSLGAEDDAMSDTRSIQIPLTVSEWATLNAAFPLTESKWRQMLDVLNAMKPALVSAADEIVPNGTAIAHEVQAA